MHILRDDVNYVIALEEAFGYMAVTDNHNRPIYTLMKEILQLTGNIQEAEDLEEAKDMAFQIACFLSMIFVKLGFPGCVHQDLETNPEADQ